MLEFPARTGMGQDSGTQRHGREKEKWAQNGRLGKQQGRMAK